MRQIKLYYSEMNKNHFTNELHRECEICRQLLNRNMVHVYSWRKESVQEQMYCMTCFNKGRTFGKVIEKRLVLIVDDLPEDACPVLLTPPILKDTAISSFEAVSQLKASADQVIDRTVYAGRKEGSWRNAEIGSPDMKLLAAKDRPLSEKSGLKLLEASK